MSGCAQPRFLNPDAPCTSVGRSHKSLKRKFAVCSGEMICGMIARQGERNRMRHVERTRGRSLSARQGLTWTEGGPEIVADLTLRPWTPSVVTENLDSKLDSRDLSTPSSGGPSAEERNGLPIFAEVVLDVDCERESNRVDHRAA